MESEGKREVVLPSPRTLAVARAYVEGLERDRQRLIDIQQDNMRLTWECVQMANRNRALRRLAEALKLSLHVPEHNREIDLIEAVLEDDPDAFFGCPCGHSKFDHDEEGCSFLHCKNICA